MDEQVCSGKGRRVVQRSRVERQEGCQMVVEGRRGRFLGMGTSGSRGLVAWEALGWLGVLCWVLLRLGEQAVL